MRAQDKLFSGQESDFELEDKGSSKTEECLFALYENIAGFSFW